MSCNFISRPSLPIPYIHGAAMRLCLSALLVVVSASASPNATGLVQAAPVAVQIEMQTHVW